MNTTTLSRTGRCRRLMLAGCAAVLLPALAVARDFPSKPITLVVPATAGGPTDLLARTIGQAMAKDLGQPVVVENVGGAGGTIALAKVARAPADGHTLVLANVGMLAVAPVLYDKLPYHPTSDFTPIASVADATQVLSVRAGLPVQGLNDFADYVKANQAKMNYGTAGVGTGSHLGGILLNAALGTHVQPVHYKGGMQATQDVMAGTLDFMVEGSTTAVASIASGKIKGLAVLRQDRIAALPAVPPTSESNYPDLRFEIWNMVAGPRGLPPAVAQRLNTSLNHVLADPAMQKDFEQRGLSLPPAAQRTQAGSAELLSSELNRWSRLMKASGEKTASN
nr:tripartite tricarboxylate transporter substrate binding protein [Variovorax boronicumulans]